MSKEGTRIRHAPQIFFKLLLKLTKASWEEFLPFGAYQQPGSVFSKTAEVFTRAYPSLR